MMTTDQAIEAAARAMCAATGKDPDKLNPAPRGAIGLVRLWTLWKPQARAAAPILMEQGARLALEAAADVAAELTAEILRGHDYGECASTRIHALDPAEIVKGSEQ